MNGWKGNMHSQKIRKLKWMNVRNECTGKKKKKKGIQVLPVRRNEVREGEKWPASSLLYCLGEKYPVTALPGGRHDEVPRHIPGMYVRPK